MQRTVIQIARVRLSDVRPGDVVNGRPDEEHGWFEVLTVRVLPSGELMAGGSTNAQSIKGTDYNLVGMQIAKRVEIEAARLDTVSISV